jgi:calcineurin-like phosphoesterase family protein
MIYFSSDSHFYHQNVIRYCNRPFSSVEEMNEIMIKNWNEIVDPDDTVYCLGDFSLAIRPVEVYSSRLMGKKRLISGNHDWTHSYHKKSRKLENQKKWIEFYEQHGWEVLNEQVVIDLGDNVGFVDMCHHPYEDDSNRGDKYARWRPMDEGRILLCGHIHQHWKTKLSPKGSLMINVGVDVWDFKPVSLAQIIELIEEHRNK